MSDPAAREWRFYIDDMIAFAEKVLAYTRRSGPGALRRQRLELRRDFA